MMNYYTFDDLIKIDRNNREKLYKEMRKVVLGESEKLETAYWWVNKNNTVAIARKNILGYINIKGLIYLITMNGKLVYYAPVDTDWFNVEGFNSVKVYKDQGNTIVVKEDACAGFFREGNILYISLINGMVYPYSVFVSEEEAEKMLSGYREREI